MIKNKHQSNPTNSSKKRTLSEFDDSSIISLQESTQQNKKKRPSRIPKQIKEIKENVPFKRTFHPYEYKKVIGFPRLLFTSNHSSRCIAFDNPINQNRMNIILERVVQFGTKNSFPLNTLSEYFIRDNENPNVFWIKRPGYDSVTIFEKLLLLLGRYWMKKLFPHKEPSIHRQNMYECCEANHDLNGLLIVSFPNTSIVDEEEIPNPIYTQLNIEKITLTRNNDLSITFKKSNSSLAIDVVDPTKEFYSLLEKEKGIDYEKLFLQENTQKKWVFAEEQWKLTITYQAYNANIIGLLNSNKGVIKFNKKNLISMKRMEKTHSNESLEISFKTCNTMASKEEAEKILRDWIFTLMLFDQMPSYLTESNNNNSSSTAWEKKPAITSSNLSNFTHTTAISNFTTSNESKDNDTHTHPNNNLSRISISSLID